MSIRNTLAATTILTICLGLAGAASAGPLCLQDIGGIKIYFSKVKLPKKPGQTTALQGVRYSPSGPSLGVGSATMIANGTIRAAMHFHQAADVLGNDFSMSWATDATLAGTASFDNDGDYQKDDGTLELTTVDCSSVTIP